MSYTSTDTISITSDYINNTNYTGNFNQDIFSNTSSTNSFRNNAIVLGGGGDGINGNKSNNGKNGLINSGSITSLTNTGAFLGGGGAGGDFHGEGGAGGGGGSSNGNLIKGGSLSTNVNVNNTGNPGAGPGGNVTTNFSGYQGGNKFGPFGGSGVSYLENMDSVESTSNGNNATINGGGKGGNIDTISNIYNYINGGGGGYGGGDGGDINNINSLNTKIGGGGGGGGGGRGGQIINSTGSVSYIGGDGGYGISNSGTITTLVNSQGGLISDTDPNNYPYGPLFYCGNTPTNYNILINSTTQYGQLWCTGVTDTTGSITFGIADGSTLTTGTYSSVLKFNSGTVTLNNTTGTYNNYNWTLVQNGLYYDLVLTSSSLPCFMEGSKILTNKGYQLIENLRNGDLIKTLKNGYLPIVMIGKSEIYNSGNEERIKNRLYNLSCKNYPKLTEDLVLTGCHSILVDTLTDTQIIEMGGEEKRLYMTDDKLRLFCYLDSLSDPYDKEGIFTIYHIALENENYYGNYGIYANGLLVETCSIRYLKELSNMILIE